MALNWKESKDVFVSELSSIYPKFEAESIFFLLLEELLGISKQTYSLDKLQCFDSEQEKQWQVALEALKEERPIQHILKKAFCYEYYFEVNEHVLIPRQETEELIDLILKQHTETHFKVLDIGTGTACIAINLKKQRPSWQVWACDVSDLALQVAQRNANRHEAELFFRQSDILNSQAWGDYPDASFDLIVSNPPYVCQQEKDEMKNNVLLHDPHLALFVADDNPLIFYDKIADFAQKKLKAGGYLYFEINERFGKETEQLLENKSFENIHLLKDMQGKDRMIYGRVVS